MKNYIYKIRHIETGKFVRIKLSSVGIDGWKENNVLNGNPLYGKVLYDTHCGWTTPPKPSNEEFAKIGCEVVKYEIIENEVI